MNFVVLSILIKKLEVFKVKSEIKKKLVDSSMKYDCSWRENGRKCGNCGKCGVKAINYDS